MQLVTYHADQIDGVGVVVAEKIEQPVGLTAAGPEGDVGDEQSAKMLRGLGRRPHSGPIEHCSPSIGSRFVSQSDDGATSRWWIAFGKVVFCRQAVAHA